MASKKSDDVVADDAASVAGINISGLRLADDWAKKLGPAFQQVMAFVDKAQPVVAQAYTTVSDAYAKIPADWMPVIVGLLLCFYGGTFCLTIAAVQAFYMCGYENTKKCFLDLAEEWKPIAAELAKDAADIEQSSKGGSAGGKKASASGAAPTPSELIARKAHIFFSTCKKPERVQAAIAGIVTGFAGVLAVLQSNFARTVALGAALAADLEKRVITVVKPRISKSVPAEYLPWVDVAISYAVKLVAIAFAWTVQKFMSAIQSALLGGLMASRAALKVAHSHGIMTHVKDTETMLDEHVGWALAALGVYSQVSNAFGVPFPLNLLLWPVQIVETVLVGMVSK